MQFHTLSKRIQTYSAALIVWKGSSRKPCILWLYASQFVPTSGFWFPSWWFMLRGKSLHINQLPCLRYTPAIDKIIIIKNVRAWVSMVSYLKNCLLNSKANPAQLGGNWPDWLCYLAGKSKTDSRICYYSHILYFLFNSLDMKQFVRSWN